MGKEGLFMLDFVAQSSSDGLRPLIYCRQPEKLNGSFPLLVKHRDQSDNGHEPVSQFSELARLDLLTFLDKAAQLKECELTGFYHQFALQGGFYDPAVRQDLANILNINLTFFFDNRVEEALRAFDQHSLDAPRGVLHREPAWWSLTRRLTIPGKIMVTRPNLGPAQQQFEPALPVGQYRQFDFPLST